MNRRGFLRLSLLGPLLGLAVPRVGRAVPARRILIQTSPVAGFQYHHGETLWPHLAVGQRLSLVREPGNHYDRRAVALYRRDRKLGYVPQRENVVVAQMLDRGETLRAEITHLLRCDDPWRRIEFKVELEG
jgi:hypothetical protein